MITNRVQQSTRWIQIAHKHDGAIDFQAKFVLCGDSPDKLIAFKNSVGYSVA